MAELDIDDMRQMEAELQGMPLCNTRMTFYYDETGNCGKFKVTETGFNDSIMLCTLRGATLTKTHFIILMQSTSLNI